MNIVDNSLYLKVLSVLEIQCFFLQHSNLHIDRRFKREVISSNFVKGDVHDVEESITSGYVQGKPTISLKIRGKIGKKKANPKHTTNGYKDLTLDQKWHDISTIAKKKKK